MQGGSSGILHKRLIAPNIRRAALRRRSNSASYHSISFFDAPPPPSSRLHPSPAPKPKPKSNPNPIALLSDHPDALHPHLAPPLPHTARSASPPHTSPAPAPSAQHEPTQDRPQHDRYQLDVGAYGIPKRTHHHPAHVDGAHLAVQVGEDAYFVRHNAMGVADGVGGWARASSASPSSSGSHRPHHPPTPTPSALFARRLMHYTSAQLDLPDPEVPEDAIPSLDSHLEDLADGIDVLQILESAYAYTLKAHVEPSTHAPLHVGSSTALVAVLDHNHSVDIGVASSDPHQASTEAQEGGAGAGAGAGGPVLKIAHVGDCMGMLVRGEEIVWRSEEMWWAFNTPVQLAPPPPSRTPSPPPPPSLSSTQSTLASLFSSLSLSTPFDPKPRPKDQHPATTTPTPNNSAQVLTLPVQADDILILASDGLSDNLWDEDVLDEVVRFRRVWGGGADGSPQPQPTQRRRPRSRSASLSVSRPPSPSPLSSSYPAHTPISALRQPTAGFSTTSSVPASVSPLSLPSPIRLPSPSIPSSPLHRHTLAALLSEALCSRARRVSEKRGNWPADAVHRGRRRHHHPPPPPVPVAVSVSQEEGKKDREGEDDKEEDTPFGRRAREAGKFFVGGKRDDISVLVAVVARAPIPREIVVGGEDEDG